MWLGRFSGKSKKELLKIISNCKKKNADTVKRRARNKMAKRSRKINRRK